jgi:opacity protein-like surface antigen
MRKSAALFCILLATCAASAGAQAVPSATARHLSITAGGTASVFQPSYSGDWAAETVPVSPCYPNSVCNPVANRSPYPLFGIGAYVDLRFTHWIQLEAEGRWMRYNQNNPTGTTNGGIYFDNYLVGPRVPLHRIWKANPYAKALVGYGKMNLGYYPGLCSGDCVAAGRFTALAFGGGADIKLTRRVSLRALDVEYQYWPQWGNSSLAPYGVSVGVGYRIF